MDNSVTIVVWDGKTLAVDKLRSYSGLKTDVRKAWYSNNSEGKCILSGTGDAIQISRVGMWYESGSSITKFPQKCLDSDNWQFIVVDKNGLFYYEHPWKPILVGFDHCAFGYGSHFAYGALEMGANAERAVEVANKYSTNCGMGVELFKL